MYKATARVTDLMPNMLAEMVVDAYQNKYVRGLRVKSKKYDWS